MAKVLYQDVWYASQEELDFKHWLDEAFTAGLIEGYQKQEKGPDTLELIGKQYYTVDGKKKHCFSNVKYTPDFVVTGCSVKQMLNKDMFDNWEHYVDVKGGFSQHNDNKSFQIIRKMMYHFKGIYVHRVVPEELFLSSWVPELCRYTKVQKKVQKKYLKTPTIKEYLKRKNDEG